VAEYFRDVEGQDVLVFIDNIFRFTQRAPGVGAAGADASAVGYQPTTRHREGELRSGSPHKKGSITSVQAIYVPATTLTTPAPATASRTWTRPGAVVRSFELGI